MDKRQKKYHQLEILYSVWVIFTVLFVGVSFMMLAKNSLISLKAKLYFWVFTIANICALVCLYRFVLQKNGYNAHYLCPCTYNYACITYDKVKTHLSQKPFKGSLTIDKPDAFRSTFFHKRKQGQLYRFSLFEIRDFEQKAVKRMRENVLRKQKKYIDAHNLDYEPWYAGRNYKYSPNYRLNLFITEKETDYSEKLMKLSDTSNAIRGVLQAIYCTQSGILYIPACFGGSTGRYTSLHKDILRIFDELSKTPAR